MGHREKKKGEKEDEGGKKHGEKDEGKNGQEKRENLCISWNLEKKSVRQKEKDGMFRRETKGRDNFWWEEMKEHCCLEKFRAEEREKEDEMFRGSRRKDGFLETKEWRVEIIGGSKSG